MKTLHLRRHSIKDGPNNTIGHNGLELAVAQGKIVNLGNIMTPEQQDEMIPAGQYKRQFTKLFHGPLVRTAQTGLAFCQGLGYVPKVMPVVNGLGDDALFAEIATPEFRAAVKGGLSNFEATFKIHGQEKASTWANTASQAVESMFDQMKDGETAIGFFHSPTIELVAWHHDAEASGYEGWNELSDLEGLIFTYDDDSLGKISITGTVFINKNAAA